MRFCRQFVAVHDTSLVIGATACHVTELPRALRRHRAVSFPPPAHSGHEHGSL